MYARKFHWDQGKWVAEDGLLLTFNGHDSTQEWFTEKRLELQETPEDFAGLETIPEELGWLDLYSYTKKIRMEGYNSLPYEVQLHMRLAFPLTTFILTILGVTIALGQGLHGGIAVGVGIGLVIASLYLTVLQIGCALATAGILFPSVGVWAGDIIFSALTSYRWITQCR
jgi:lipopolysaccharide export system permease protein